MKRSKQCPKCESLRVGYLPSQPDAAHGKVSARTVGNDLAQKSMWNIYRGLSGTLEAYMCADCGYYESYVKDVGLVELENLDGFRWVNPAKPKADPYR